MPAPAEQPNLRNVRSGGGVRASERRLSGLALRRRWRMPTSATVPTTQASYNGYIREHILQPAGMTQTGLSVYTPADVPGMAHGYALTGSSAALRDISGTPEIASPSGGGYSTAGDLLRFAHALMGHKLLSPAMTAAVLFPRVNSPQPGGPPVDKYTYGFAYQAVNGVTFVGHNGGTPGYEGQIDIYPKTGYAVVILTNQDQVLRPAIQQSESMLTGS